MCSKPVSDIHHLSPSVSERVSDQSSDNQQHTISFPVLFWWMIDRSAMSSMDGREEVLKSI